MADEVKPELEADLRTIRRGLCVGATGPEQTAAIDALHRTASTARAGLADSERLDWLEKQEWYSLASTRRVTITFPEADTLDSLRATIDAARGVHPEGTPTSGASGGQNPAAIPADAVLLASVEQWLREDGKTNPYATVLADAFAGWLSRERSERPQDVSRVHTPAPTEDAVKAGMVRRMNVMHAALTEVYESMDFNQRFTLENAPMLDGERMAVRLTHGTMERVRHAMSEAAYEGSPTSAHRVDGVE